RIDKAIVQFAEFLGGIAPFFNWNSDGKCRSFTHDTIHLNGSMMKLHQFLGQGQPDPVSLLLSSQPVVVKRDEYLIEFARSDPHPGVLHADDQMCNVVKMLRMKGELYT